MSILNITLNQLNTKGHIYLVFNEYNFETNLILNDKYMLFLTHIFMLVALIVHSLTMPENYNKFMKKKIRA